MPNLISTPTIILHTFSVRENDLICTALSRDLGVIKIYCRCAKNSHKRFAGGIDIFTCGVFELEEGRNELMELKSVSERHSFEAFRLDLTKYCLASFCLETALNLTHEGDADAKKLFNPLFHVLNNLNEKPITLSSYAVLGFFMLNTLEVSGIDPFAQETALAEDAAQWCRLMLNSRQPIVQRNKTTINKTLSFLVHHAKQFSNKAFYTEREMLLPLANL